MILAYRVATIGGEEVIDDGLADYAYFGGCLDILFGEHVAVLDFVASYLQVVRTDAVDRGRGVVGAVDRLPAAVDGRRNGRDKACFVHNVFVIL